MTSHLSLINLPLRECRKIVVELTVVHGADVMKFPKTAMAAAVTSPIGFPAWPRAVSTSDSVASSIASNSSSSSAHSSTTATPTSSSSVVTTTTQPLFQDSTTTPASSQGSSFPKMTLEYLLISLFVLIFVGLLAHRIIYRRRRNLPPPTPTISLLPQRFPRTTGLNQVPPYPYASPIHAADTDASGRRIMGGIGASDHDDYIGDKDLPAYEMAGGPPKYMAYELDVLSNHCQDAGNSNGDPGPHTSSDDGTPAHVPLDSPPSTDPHRQSGGVDAQVGGPETLAVPDAVHVRE